MSKYQDSYFLKLQDHIANGSKDELTVEESDYEDLLFSVAGIIRREGKPAAMAWLKADKGCTRHVSERLCYEAINLFYATDYVRAEAWRNVLFEKMMNAARLWEKKHIILDEKTGQTSSNATAKEYDAYTKIIKVAADLKRLSERDADAVPLNIKNQQINIYGTNAQDVGIPATDKRAILQADYFKALPKKHQKRLEMEAGLKPLDIDAMLDSSIELANEVTGE